MPIVERIPRFPFISKGSFSVYPASKTILKQERSNVDLVDVQSPMDSYSELLFYLLS